MATKRRKNKRSARNKGKTGARIGQKILVASSFIVLVLCAASVTWSFFFGVRGGGKINRHFSIVVLNGTGEQGLAHDVRGKLLRRGIDVIAEDNAPRFDYAESVLIAKKRGVDIESLGEILGCKNVIVQISEDAIEDASLILGADYRELNLGWDVDE